MAQLKSDHVNYLIWRYLQENGYGKAAVQLQRDWSNNNPESLPFAQDVKPYTLISAIQDGLNYDELLASLQPDEANVSNAPTYARRYTFAIPRKRPAEDEPQDTRTTLQEIASGSRKRQKLDSTVNDQHQTPTTSRPSSGRRKSAKVTPLDLQRNGDAMDVDNEEDAQEQEAEAELEEESEVAIPVPTLDIGTSTGTQNEEFVDKRLARSLFDIDLPGADILNCRWSRLNPLQCTITGGSVWQTLALPAYAIDSDREDEDEQESEPSIVHHGPKSKNFFVSATDEGERNTNVGVIWGNKDLNPKAYAWANTEAGYANNAGVLVYEKLGKMATIAITPSTVLFVRFNHDSTRLLAGSASEEGEGIISIYDVEDLNQNSGFSPKGGTSTAAHYSSFALPHIALNATFSGFQKIVSCGENAISISEPSRVSEFRPESPIASDWETTHVSTNQAWELLADRDAIGSRVACGAPDTGFLGLLTLDDMSFSSKQAHEQQVTSIHWQPRFTVSPDFPKQLLASSSTDGTVKLWTTESALECIHVLNMDPWVPAMALVFNKSGRYVAAAGDRQIKAWDVDDRAKLGVEVNGESVHTEYKDKLLVAHWQSDEEEKPSESAQDRFQVARAQSVEGAVEPDQHVDSTIEAEPISLPPVKTSYREPRNERERLHEEMQIDARSPTPSPKAEDFQDQSGFATQENGAKIPQVEDASTAENANATSTSPGQHEVHPGEDDDTTPPFHTLSFNAQSDLLSYTYGSKVRLPCLHPQEYSSPTSPS